MWSLIRLFLIKPQSNPGVLYTTVSEWWIGIRLGCLNTFSVRSKTTSVKPQKGFYQVAQRRQEKSMSPVSGRTGSLWLMWASSQASIRSSLVPAWINKEHQCAPIRLRNRGAFLSPPSQTTAGSVKERREGLLAPQCRLCWGAGVDFHVFRLHPSGLTR